MTDAEAQSLGIDRAQLAVVHPPTARDYVIEAQFQALRSHELTASLVTLTYHDLAPELQAHLVDQAERAGVKLVAAVRAMRAAMEEEQKP